MKFTTSNVGGTVEILATDKYQAIPIFVAGTDVVKAGMPLTADGVSAADGSGAAGILLYDVNPAENPNGALVVAGVVDWAKCKSHSGATATAATMKSALPAIEFRENIATATVLSVTPTTLSVAEAGTKTATVSGNHGAVTVESSDETKATVAILSGTITVTGVAAGECTITATDAYGDTATIAVTVTAAAVG